MKKFIPIIIILFASISINAQKEIKGKSNSLNVNISKANYDNGIPSLSTTVVFNEPSGNKLLDAEENAEIIVTIKNDGSGSAFDVKADLSSDNSQNISFDKNKTTGEIKPGESKTYKFSIKGYESLLNGQRKFSISFAEFGGFMPAPVNLSIGTQKFKAPQLAFIEAGIEELQGNGNNIIENGELIKATLLIQNKGQGDALNSNYNILINDKGIVTVKNHGGNNYPLSKDIGNIKPGGSMNISFIFSATWNYKGANQLPIEIKLRESRGTYGSKTNVGLELNSQSLASKDMKVEGTYSSDVEIEDVSLSVDIDKNIPVTGKNNPNAYALIFGNEDYTKYQSNLKSESNVDYARNDAKIFKEYCIKTLGIPENNITYKTDAISTQMKQDILWLSNKAKYNSNAELYFYYSGHGFPDDNKESYIIPVDISGANVKNAIKLSGLYKQFTENNPKQITVFLDACFSGGGREQGLLAAKAVKVKVKKNEVSKGNLTVFSASSGDEESLFYKEKQHGIFTYFLLKKLQETSGNISYKEMSDYLKSVVPSKTEDIYRKTQTPEVNFSSDIINTWKNFKFVK